MNKPDLPQLERPEGLFKRAKDASGKALRTARDAGKRAWDRATDAPDEGKRRTKILWMTGGAIAAVIAVLFVVSRIGGDDNIQAPPATAQAISVIPVATHTFETEVSLNGEARPVRDIQVVAQASGVRILQILVDEGDTVRQGQAMARLDTALSSAQTRAAQANVAEAESAAVRARGEYQRAESIRDSGALSAEAIEQRQAAATAADARLAASRAQLAEVNARLGGGFIRAPASGLVIDRNAQLGGAVEGQVLFRIAADNRLEVAAQVAEADVLAMQEGQRATFSLVDGSTVQGTLRRLPASIDSRTRTGEALFSLPSGSRVRAGMYLRGHANLTPREVIAVPQSSVLYEGGQAYVYVVSPEPTPQPADERQASRRPSNEPPPEPTYAVARQAVALGRRDGDNVEVLSGLQTGQRIVGSGAAFLQNGDNVRVLQTPASPAQQPATSEQSAPSEGIRGREG